eukprot:CAMPEP_0182531560 /NCGR_PEP_ID=MMETSP1323-20130603/9444_1 /TAXON_ID=236787 /ORGANISM="Florenciella parvula, Strain RCC1693" /LENGTH=312 /DNA_ID=CAMNT_0024741135 /DNA_START=102 /DNA_END=1041 /DNA_ORIENTATION=-
MRLDSKRPTAVQIPPSYGIKQREGVFFRCYDEITPGVREEPRPHSIYKWCDEPQDNYFAEPPMSHHESAAMSTEGGHAHEEPQYQQARRSPSPISSSERAQLKVSPATQKRRRSSLRELPARALAYFGRKFGSARDVKKGRAFSPHDDRTDLQSPRLAATATSSLCSSPHSGDSYGVMDDVELNACGLNGLGEMDVHMQTDGFDLLSPKPAVPPGVAAGAVTEEENCLQSPKIDIYSRPGVGDRHQATGLRPRAWSRERSGSRGGVGLTNEIRAGVGVAAGVRQAHTTAARLRSFHDLTCGEDSRMSLRFRF